MPAKRSDPYSHRIHKDGSIRQGPDVGGVPTGWEWFQKMGENAFRNFPGWSTGGEWITMMKGDVQGHKEKPGVVSCMDHKTR
jgi:hypothetical protein